MWDKQRVKQKCDSEEWEVPETQSVQTVHGRRSASMRFLR